jgi:hypothetical protein
MPIRDRGEAVPIQITGIPFVPPEVTIPGIIGFATQAISSALWQAAQQPPAWGIFDDTGALAIEPDSVLDFTNRQEYDISQFPVQKGSFSDYNKVIKPFEVILRLKKAGTVDDRAAFLQDLDDLCATLDRFLVSTPERDYEDVNFERYEVVRRGAKGAFQLTEVDLYGQRIIEVQAQYSTTSVQTPDAQSEAALPTSNVGNVQPQNPDSQLAQDGELALSTQAQFPQGYN